MRQSITILSVLASGAFAADTIQFYFPGGAEGVDPVATIEKVQPSTTVFNIACPTNVDSTDCGWGPGLDYTILSGTKYLASLSYDSISMSFSCDHNTKASEMTCAVAMTGGNMDTPTPETAVLKGSDVSFITATIVQGANLLSGSGAASAAPKSTPAASSGLMTDASSSPTGRVSGSAGSASRSATGTASPAQQTGAATSVGIKVSALLAVAGVVAANVL
ncbi:hypothetical protein EK21DRAFT_105064 [Setomelanomma holmii]|uniref:Uncharacterized protein n=1 Tax=Setomelanomma holmii TaxID=210430 RepID=A0A9P4LGR3_9PLEO|nr:hypothetical protein EK21DRAFT_105064 [Setomelanomma holmii]